MPDETTTARTLILTMFLTDHLHHLERWSVLLSAVDAKDAPHLSVQTRALGAECDALARKYLPRFAEAAIADGAFPTPADIEEARATTQRDLDTPRATAVWFDPLAGLGLGDCLLLGNAGENLRASALLSSVQIIPSGEPDGATPGDWDDGGPF
jgi:hypothetical protein